MRPRRAGPGFPPASTPTQKRAAGPQRLVQTAEQPDNPQRCEMVEEIRQQDGVVGAIQLYFEDAARQKTVAAVHAGSPRIGQRKLQHSRPIYRGHPRRRISLQQPYPKSSVPRRDIQHLSRGHAISTRRSAAGFISGAIASAKRTHIG